MLGEEVAGAPPRTVLVYGALSGATNLQPLEEDVCPSHRREGCSGRRKIKKSKLYVKQMIVKHISHSARRFLDGGESSPPTGQQDRCN